MKTNSIVSFYGATGTSLFDKIDGLREEIPLSWWLSNGHVSTLYSAFRNFEHENQISYSRIHLEHKDGGFNALDYACRAVHKGDELLPPRTKRMSTADLDTFGSKDPGVLVVLLHGLSGGSHESYLRATVAAIHKRFDSSTGVECVAFNARGCALSPITSKVFWSAYQTEDLAVALAYLKTRYPAKKLIAVGFSLGANILCNYLGKSGEAATRLVDAAISISNPWDLCIADRQLKSTWLGRLYSRGMRSNLQKLFQLHKSHLLEYDFIREDQVMSATDLWNFDNVFTAKVLGFESADAYYQAASSAQHLPNVCVPLLVLNAADDPITSSLVIPYVAAKANAKVALAVSDKGGHIGWYEETDRRWFADVVTDLVKTMAADLSP